ncbi:DUF2624 family protein [Radiobacillus sp. PE A8.2]|uniref:DUF2624 family protein n=1 Tax=Radiobacillus sp. PE A8.2 TaxID=3380349 RepID=UPI003890D2AC
MNKIVHQMIVKKIKNLSSEEILTYSKQYDISINKQQAQAISSYVKKVELDPIIQADRMKMFKKLAQITDLDTAKKAQKLFNQLIKQYGVESWFQ